MVNISTTTSGSVPTPYANFILTYKSSGITKAGSLKATAYMVLTSDYNLYVSSIDTTNKKVTFKIVAADQYTDAEIDSIISKIPNELKTLETPLLESPTIDLSNTLHTENFYLRGIRYQIVLVSVNSDASKAVISVFSESSNDGKEISLGTSRVINGINVGLISASSNNFVYTAKIKITSAAINSCVDTDNGENISIKGTLTRSISNQTVVKTDYCTTIDPSTGHGRVIEYSCSESPSTVFESVVHICANTCSDGACK